MSATATLEGICPRAFVRRLRTHEDICRVDFTPLGSRTILVELEPDANFHDQWHRTAAPPGYAVEQLEADELSPDRSKDVWLYRLAETEDSTGRST